MEKRRVLDSWKEIASYLGRSIKTCRRWEHELGLPVHRLEDSPKARVFAYLDELDQWVEKTQKSAEVQKNLKIPTWGIIISSVIIVLIILAVSIWKSLFPKLPPSRLPLKPSIAVLYFQNQTGDQEFDIWEEGLCRMLITDLSQSRYLRILPDDRLFEILEKLNLLKEQNYSTGNLRKIASHAKATHILKGFLTKSGNSLQVDTIIQDAHTMDIVGAEIVRGKGDESFYTLVDELSRRIKAHFELTNEEITADLDSRIKAITTSSPEAYKLYSEARTYHFQTDYWRSLSTMQKALEIDPEFSMAWRSVAMSYSNLGLIPAKINAIKKAFDLRDRVSERERYIIEADYYKSWEKSYDKAVEAYQKLLELYPDDTIGNVNLGILYFELEEFEKALARYETTIQNDPDGHLCTWNMIETYMAMGRYDRADQIIEGYLSRNPDNISFLLKQYRVHIYQGKYDLAQADLEKCLSLDPNLQMTFDILTGHISLLRGDTEHARNQFKKMPNGRIDRRLAMANLYMLQGKFKEAETEFLKKPVLHQRLGYLYLRTNRSQSALEQFAIVEESAQIAKSISEQIFGMYAKGLAYARMKSFGNALRIAKEIRRSIPSLMYKKLFRYHDHLLGMIAFEMGNFSESIPKLCQAVQSLYAPEDNFPRIQAYFIFTLAQAYEKAGTLQSAQREFEKILALHLGRIEDGEIYAKSFYALGKIYEKQGNIAKAIEHYEKFLDLWKDADPGIEEVKDARMQLFRLQSKK